MAGQPVAIAISRLAWAAAPERFRGGDAGLAGIRQARAVLRGDLEIAVAKDYPTVENTS